MAETLALDPLIATDPEGRDHPILAAIVPTLENGGISRDGLTITYHLRRGVRWQDGARFTSRDVQFSFAAIVNPNNAAASRHGYDDVLRVDTPDAFTAVVRLKKPFAPAVHTFFAHSDTPYEILPAHLLARYGSLDRIPFNDAPVGTGPFKVVRWLHGERVDYVANDEYFFGKPKIRRITIRIVPDENTIVNLLRTHEIDWFVQPTPRTYPALKGIPGIDIRLVNFNGYYAVQVNVSRPALSDVRVRQALALAVDKRRLVRDTTFGTAVPATEDLPSFMWAFNPKAGTRKFDLPKARTLLDAAVWRAGADGIRRRNGERLTLGLAFATDSATDRLVGPAIVAMLKDAGIDVELKGYNTSLLYAPQAEGGPLASGRYDLALQPWYSGIDPDDSSQMMCDQFPPAGWNWSRYCNAAEMDEAQRLALDHYDIPTRKRAYASVEGLLARDAPFVYIWWPRQIEAVNSDLKNFRPNGIMEDWNAYEWSI